MRLGQVIRKWRVVEEISLRDLAKQIGTSAATLMRFENGNDIDGATLASILAWVLGATGKGKPPVTSRGA